jgi:hypothetical protein
MAPQNLPLAATGVRPKPLLPVHWGTFDLGLHHWAEPAETLWQLAQAAAAPVWHPRIGASVEPGAAQGEAWWREHL